jgi:hypothetical protein
MISQDGAEPPVNFTFANMGFGDFSDWVNVFSSGKGTVTLWENSGGQREWSKLRLSNPQMAAELTGRDLIQAGSRSSRYRASHSLLVH